MDTDDILRLLSGSVQRIVVGQLPPVAVSILRCQTLNVMLSSEVAIHILRAHPDLTTADWLSMPEMITRGLLICEKARPHRLVSCYQDPHSQQRFVLPMKLTKGRHEVWISSLHRSGKRQTKRYLRKGFIIKTHS
jgi:hypothetical protein